MSGKMNWYRPRERVSRGALKTDPIDERQRAEAKAKWFEEHQAETNPPSQWREDVEYALGLGLDKAADVLREGFGWRIIGKMPVFWQHWREHKELMRRAGFKVSRNQQGDWLVSYYPNESIAATENAIASYRGRITHCLALRRFVRHGRNSAGKLIN